MALSKEAQVYVLKIARRVAKDPTSANVQDAAKLAKAVMLLCGEKP